MDNIKFTLPAKAEYLLAVRLTASAIGTRRKLSIDAIESFKSAVSEGCLIILGSSGCETLNIDFYIDANELKVKIVGLGQTNKKSKDTELEFSKFMLEAMALNIEYINNSDDKICGVTFMAAED